MTQPSIVAATVAILLSTSCTVVTQNIQLSSYAPPSVIVGEVFHVSLTLSNLTSESVETSSGRFVVILENGICRSTFVVQRLEEFGREVSGPLSLLAPGSTRNVTIPVIVSSHDASVGTLTISGTYESSELSIQSPKRRVIASEPDPITIDKHAHRLTTCSEPSSCTREIDYFRYVRRPDIASRLAELLHQYSYYDAAAEAVFAQGRPADAAALRSAAASNNANASRLLELADRLEAGVSCRE